MADLPEPSAKLSAFQLAQQLGSRLPFRQERGRCDPGVPHRSQGQPHLGLFGDTLDLRVVKQSADQNHAAVRALAVAVKDRCARDQ